MNFNTVNFGMAKPILGFKKPMLETANLNNEEFGKATRTNDSNREQNQDLQDKINYHTQTQDGSVVEYKKADGRKEVRFLTLKENEAHLAGNKIVKTVNKQIVELQQLITDLEAAGEKDKAQELNELCTELSTLSQKVLKEVNNAVLLTKEDFTSRPTKQETAVAAATSLVPEPLKQKFKDVVDAIMG
jgi:hypothetical protein